MNINAAHQFTARCITTGQAVENQPRTCFQAFKQALSHFFRSDQLAVVHQGTGNHIATNVTRDKLATLEQADAQNAGGHTAENLRRSDRLLTGMGIPTAGLGNEMRIRLARIGVENPALASSIQRVHAHNVAGGVGAVGPQAAVDLARAVEKHGAPVGTALTALLAHVPGTLSPAVFNELTQIATTQPELAMKLAARATATATAAPNALTLPQLTWLVHTATTDDVLADLRGPNFTNPAPVPPLLFQPALHIKLDAAAFANVQARYNGMDGLHFDAATNTVHSKFQYQQLAEIAPHLSDAARNAIPPTTPNTLMTTWARVDYSFGNPVAVTARQDARLNLLADCISQYSNPDYGAFDAAIHVPTLGPALTGLNGNQSLTHLLGAGQQNFPGITVSESHNTTTAKAFLRGNMANLVAQGVTTLYIEHIQQEYQPLIDQYLASPPGTAMPPALDAFLRANDNSQGIGGAHPDNLRGLVESAKQNNLRVIGLDNNNLSRRVYAGSMEIRDVAVNRLGHQVIQGDAGARGVGKYVILAGRAHNHSHAGLLNGIPGFAQLLSIPAVVPNVGGGLDLDPDVVGNRHA